MKKNTDLLKKLIDNYNKLSFTHYYIYGFIYKNNLYMVKATAEIMPYILTIDKASRGAGYSLRFKPTIAQKTLLLAKGATLICSKEYFNSVVASNCYNKGENFEKIVTEQIFHQTWSKDNLPFTDGGDITDGTTAYQIKFEKATFINEKTLARLS